MLFGVAHDEDAGPPRHRLHRRRPTANRAGPAIARVGVLELVDQQVAHLSVEPLLHPARQFRARQQGQGAALQVVHVDEARARLRASYSASAARQAARWRRVAGGLPIQAALRGGQRLHRVVEQGAAAEMDAPGPRRVKSAAQPLSKSLACSSAVAAFCAVAAWHPASGPAPAAGAAAPGRRRAGSNAGGGRLASSTPSARLSSTRLAKAASSQARRLWRPRSMLRIRSRPAGPHRSAPGRGSVARAAASASSSSISCSSGAMPSFLGQQRPAAPHGRTARTSHGRCAPQRHARHAAARPARLRGAAPGARLRRLTARWLVAPACARGVVRRRVLGQPLRQGAGASRRLPAVKVMATICCGAAPASSARRMRATSIQVLPGAGAGLGPPAARGSQASA